MLKSSENFCLFRVRNVGQFSKILALNNEQKLYYQPTFENLGQDTPDTVCTILGKNLCVRTKKFVNFISSGIFDEEHWCFNDSKNIKG